MFAMAMLLHLVLSGLRLTDASVDRAVAIMQKDGNGETIGVINLAKINCTSNQSGCLHVNGTLNGLSPGDHGFHIHLLGDQTNKCLSTLGHFNPENKEHGGPNDTERHVGDLGNVHVDSNGIAIVDIIDAMIQLEGPHSVVGRSIVVHVGTDDLGRGGQPDSKTTGHAGARFACGVIGISGTGSTVTTQRSEPNPIFKKLFLTISLS